MQRVANRLSFDQRVGRICAWSFKWVDCWRDWRAWRGKESIHNVKAKCVVETEWRIKLCLAGQRSLDWWRRVTKILGPQRQNAPISPRGAKVPIQSLPKEVWQVSELRYVCLSRERPDLEEHKTEEDSWKVGRVTPKTLPLTWKDLCCEGSSAVLSRIKRHCFTCKSVYQGALPWLDWNGRMNDHEYHEERSPTSIQEVSNDLSTSPEWSLREMESPVQTNFQLLRWERMLIHLDWWGLLQLKKDVAILLGIVSISNSCFKLQAINSNLHLCFDRSRPVLCKNEGRHQLRWNVYRVLWRAWRRVVRSIRWLEWRWEVEVYWISKETRVHPR